MIYNNEEAIQTAREAQLIQSVIRPYVDDKVKMVVTRMVNDYRAGNTDHDTIVGRIGEIRALMDVVEQLDHAQRMGHAAMQKEYADGS